MNREDEANVTAVVVLLLGIFLSIGSVVLLVFAAFLSFIA